ncbi:hypothetical protein MIR68_009017 [Amoeboaphelidium protococcarum]|nr:hypothetical protein MIR68_009017 [Amoeboaphelidium protococcarum]
MDSLINTYIADQIAFNSRLSEIREWLNFNQLPDQENNFTCNTRAKLWKLLLGVDSVSATEYKSLIGRGPSSFYEKIKKDTNRTFKADSDFKSMVDEGKLIRVLNAFIWKIESDGWNDQKHKFTYVQGMNVFAGIFLYVMPELDAFYCFFKFITQVCPQYVQPQLDGVHHGLELLDEALKECDYEIWNHFKVHKLIPQTYGFPTVMTFSACTEPLSQAIFLWDYYIANGFHCNIVSAIAQFQLMKQDLLKSSSPMKLVRVMPSLDSKAIIERIPLIASTISDDLWKRICVHMRQSKSLISYKSESSVHPSSDALQDIDDLVIQDDDDNDQDNVFD